MPKIEKKNCYQAQIPKNTKKISNKNTQSLRKSCSKKKTSLRFRKEKISKLA